MELDSSQEKTLYAMVIERDDGSVFTQTTDDVDMFIKTFKRRYGPCYYLCDWYEI